MRGHDAGDGLGEILGEGVLCRRAREAHLRLDRERRELLPGLGRLVFQGITQRDLIVVKSVVMLLVFAVILVNFLVDLSYLLVDPRLRRR